jgi:uncharacterized protein with PQ loop repeat
MALLLCIVIGVSSLFFAFYGVVTGKALGRGGKVNRTTHPVSYWFIVSAQFALAALFLAILFSWK